MVRTSKNSVRFIAIALLAATSAGCASSKPEVSSPSGVTRACPLHRAPVVTDYGPAGVYAMYHYVIQNASKEEVATFYSGRISAGFAVAQTMFNINGKDTLVVRGARAMRTQAEVDDEFDTACAAGSGRVYLEHAFHQLFDPANPEPTSVRIR